MKAKKITPEQFETAKKAAFDNLPSLGEEIERWVENSVLGYSRYMFCFKESNVNFGHCTHCGQTMALNYGERLRHNEIGRCPSCGSVVKFKDAGRKRGSLIDREYIVVAQPLPDKGIAVRSFFVEKDFSDDYTGVRTKYIEDYRVYFNKDIDCAWKYAWVYDYQHGNWKKIWERMTTIPCPNAHQTYYAKDKIYNNYYGFDDRTFSKTNLNYAQISEFMDAASGHGEENPCGYLDMFVKNPQLTERIMKEGFEKVVVDRIQKNDKTLKINLRAKNVASALNLNKSEVRRLSGKDSNQIEAYRFCKKYALPYENSEKYTDTKQKRACLINISEFAPINKVVKYLRKQDESADLYRDYLRECRDLKLNVKSPGVLFPQNLRKAHQQNIELIYARREEERARQQAKENAKLAKMFEKFQKNLLPKYRKKYTFASGQFFIRPAESREELIGEGMELHHCVGRYVQRYIQGETIILFVRKRSEPDKPFYTMEIDKHDSMVQCRGKFNCGRTPEVEQFVSEFLENLRSNKSKPQKAQVA